MHSLGSESAAARLAVPALIEVNLSGEDSKSGVAPERLPDLLRSYDKGVKASGRARKHMRSCDERAAADASDLLAPEDGDGADARPLHGLDAGHHAERAVEAASIRDAVQVRSRPHRTCPGV